MRTHKELLIATRVFACEQRWRSWWHFGSTLALAAGVVCLTCSEVHWALRIPASVVLGLLIVRLFVIYHDHQHGAILGGSRLADCLMRAIGLLILSPSSAWKRSHDHHHAHNSKLSGPNVGSFALLTVEEYRNSTPRQRIAYIIERHWLTMLCGYLTVFLFGMCIRPLLANPLRHLDGLLAIACHGSVLVWLGFDELDDLFLAAIIPCTIASAAGAYLFYAQHNFPGAQVHSVATWRHSHAALDSSSYIPMGRLMRWITANIGYHHVHHLNARIPFYRLPEAMAALPELQSPRTTTLHPRDMAACLRLRLWDPTTGRLVPWSALQRPSPAAAPCRAA